MKSLWCDEVSSFEGDFYSLPACLQNPKPVQTPHPPLFFGGESEAALRRVAELGQGWYAYDRSPDELRRCLVRLDELLAEAGRSRADVQIYASPHGRPDEKTLDPLRELGIDQAILPLFARDADGLRSRADALASQTLA